VVLATGVLVDDVPEHELASADVLRVLDATEHNMERLNVRARGSGRTYKTLVLEGPLSRAQLQQALDALVARHPLLGARIVRQTDGTLAYARIRATAGAVLQLASAVVSDFSTLPELLEADMNAGAMASSSGPLFVFTLLEPPGLEDGASGRRALVMVGHHCACDGVSSLALLHELLEQLANPLAQPSLEDPPLRNPFCLDHPAPELAQLESELRIALDRDDPDRRARLEALQGRFEALEEHLLAQRDSAGRLPAALLTVHGCLSSFGAQLSPARGIVPEIEVTGSTRYESARTAFLKRSLGVETTQALRRAAKQRELTVHGALGAATLIALAAESATQSPRPERLALASAVSLRKQLVPPLPTQALRMAVDIVVSRIPVEPGASFWELARRVGDDVARSTARCRPLSSSFRTVPRDFNETPPGVALPLLSNLGRAELRTQYGPLKVLELGTGMATHGSFQLALLAFTFAERLNFSFYSETPTVSRATLERFADRLLQTLSAAATGDEPTAS
jgi:hypothetical protein